MSEFFPKHKRSTLTQVALDNIRHAIENGHLKPGQRIVESQLAKEMDISRFPIREALRYLEQEGLVVIEPFKGVSVAAITPKDLQDLMTVRCALEELAIRMFINHATPARLEKLESAVAAMQEALDTNDVNQIVEADLRFHEYICEFSDNRRLINAWRPLASQIKVCLKLEYPVYRRGEDFVATHMPILNAIRKKDDVRAEQLIRLHIYTALEHVSNNIKRHTTEGKQSNADTASAKNDSGKAKL